MTDAIRVTTGTTAVIPAPVFTAPDGYTPVTLEDAPTVTLVDDLDAEVEFTDPDEDNGWRITIAAGDVAQPARLTATWTADVDSIEQIHTQQIDVVSRLYVPLLELTQIPGLESDKYTPTLLDELEAEFEDIAERYTGHAWVRRFASEHHDHRSHTRLILGHTYPRSIVTAVDNESVPIDTTDWVLYDTGRVAGAWLSGLTHIRYVYGQDDLPMSLVNACKDYVRSKALERVGGNRIGRDVLSSNDGSGGSIRYSTPDWAAGRPTGYLDIDRVLNALGGPLPGIA